MGEPLDGLPASWPSRGPDFNRWSCDAAGFLALIAKHEGFWCADYALKYLSLSVDTRSGHFTMKDRDGNRVEPERVLEAIRKWHRWHPPEQSDTPLQPELTSEGQRGSAAEGEAERLNQSPPPSGDGP